LETLFRLGDVTLSGRERRPDHGSPVGIVLALHGGGYGAGYWDFPPTSLLAIAAARGQYVIAIDRPGYGAAFACPMPLAVQADLILDLVDQLLDREGPVPVLLAGHSMGGILASMIAADPRAAPRISAIDICGVPLVYADAMQAALIGRRLADGQTHFPAIDAAQSRQLFFGPDGSFTAEALVADAALLAPIPGAELPDAAFAPRDLPATMRRITLPVRMTFAEDERSSVATPEVAATARRLLSASSHSLIRFEPRTGHNISLHSAGRTFHEGMIDWFESIVQERP
jgi:pimeloyl-ACP methyl ester carboxylesterase